MKYMNIENNMICIIAIEAWERNIAVKSSIKKPTILGAIKNI
jgi:hypothetical protein